MNIIYSQSTIRYKIHKFRLKSVRIAAGDKWINRALPHCGTRNCFSAFGPYYPSEPQPGRWKIQRLFLYRVEALTRKALNFSGAVIYICIYTYNFFFYYTTIPRALSLLLRLSIPLCVFDVLPNYPLIEFLFLFFSLHLSSLLYNIYVIIIRKKNSLASMTANWKKTWRKEPHSTGARWIVAEDRDDIYRSWKGNIVGYKFLWTHLLSAIAGKIEGKHREKRYSHAWNDDVDRVEKCFPAHRYVKRDVQIRLVATSVKLFVPANKRHTHTHTDYSIFSYIGW